MPTGAWLLIGVGSALVILAVLLVFVIPSGPRRPRLTPRRLTAPQLKAPAASPVGALLTGFSYLYAPLSYPRLHYSVGGRLDHAIGRIEAVDPSLAPERVGLALQQMVDVVSSPEELPPPPEGGQPTGDLFDQPRNEEQI
ncbi:MAG TPA: hypothetical protein VFT17_06365 [Propionibacteriaceae bacterium]|nr:hypothetical protein [Propionibacteriaceae bacterium]